MKPKILFLSLKWKEKTNKLKRKGKKKGKGQKLPNAANSPHAFRFLPSSPQNPAPLPPISYFSCKLNNRRKMLYNLEPKKKKKINLCRGGKGDVSTEVGGKSIGGNEGPIKSTH